MRTYSQVEDVQTETLDYLNGRINSWSSVVRELGSLFKGFPSYDTNLSGDLRSARAYQAKGDAVQSLGFLVST